MREVSRVLVVHGRRVLAVAQGDDFERSQIPGGGIDRGESPASAAARELCEETGLTALELSPLLVVEQGGRRTFVFVAVACGKVRSSHEGIAHWATVRQLLDGAYGEFHEVVLERSGVI